MVILLKSYTQKGEMSKEWHQKAVSFYFYISRMIVLLRIAGRFFGRMGPVLDVFLPVKKNKKGRRFGFVRFLSGSDTQNLEEKLNSIWIGSFKLRINVCKFERAGSSSSSTYAKVNGDTSVPLKNLQQNVLEEVSYDMEFSVSGSPSLHSEPGDGTLVNGNMSAFQLELFLCTSEEWWLNRCLVGDLNNKCFLPELQRLVDRRGAGRCKVKLFGYMKVFAFLVEEGMTE